MKVEISTDVIYAKTTVDNYIQVHTHEKETALRHKGYKKVKAVPSPDILACYKKDSIVVQFVNTEKFQEYVQFFKDHHPDDLSLKQAIALPD